MLLETPMHPHAAQIVRIASHRAGLFGAARTVDLAAAAVDEGLDIGEVHARDTLTRCSGAEFLDDQWFWLPRRTPNRLATLSRRILSVASPLDVATIRAGVCRTYPGREERLVPPPAVLEAFLDAHPGFAIDAQGRVRPTRALDYRVELGKADVLFVEVLRASWTGVLDPPSFRDACVARSMTPQTFGACAAHSAVLDQPAPDLWCLRGTRISAITAAALRHAKGVRE